MGLYQRASPFPPSLPPPNVLRPGRDGALENSIIVYENTHRITNRMTGGGTGRCLQTTEAGGLGEWWSDAMAEWVPSRLTLIMFGGGLNRKMLPCLIMCLDNMCVLLFFGVVVVIYYVGQVLNQTGGIWSYPYSTSSWVLHTSQDHPHPFNPWFIYQLHQSFKIFKREKSQRTSQ